jgi:hypothetical protein
MFILDVGWPRKLTYCSSLARSILPNATLKCWPVRRPKARSRVVNTTTWVTSVRNEQMRKTKLRRPMNSRKNPISR